MNTALFRELDARHRPADADAGRGGADGAGSDGAGTGAGSDKQYCPHLG